MRVNLGVLYASVSRQAFWFRFGRRGVGLQALHRSSEPLFSERYGYRRFWPPWPRAPWRFRLLERF